MKKIISVFLSALLCIPLSGCHDIHEPNSIAYVVAIGVDKSEGRNYNITIQFAKPVQISGGSDEGGGGGEGNITENITIEAPAFFSAITMANQIVSKKFDLSHAKLIVFSEEVAREGINNFIQIISRNSELRPNIYLAVSLSSAQEYLESVKPMIEINPVKYYQLIYENNNSLYAPNNLAQDFSFSENSIYVDSVLPLAGVLPELEKKESEGKENGGGSSSNQKSSGTQKPEETGADSADDSKSESGEPEQPAGDISQPPKNKTNFEYDIPNYVPGEVPKKTQNKSEVIGMALFSEDKMIGTMGSIDSEIYNMILGTFSSSYIPFKNTDNDDLITMRIQQDKRPKIRVDTSGSTPKINIDMELKGEIASVPHYYMENDSIKELVSNVKISTEEAVEDFLYKTSQTYNKDICGFGSYAKRNFLTNQSFNEYKWREKYKDAEFNVNIDFSVRRTGLILRSAKNIVKE